MILDGVIILVKYIHSIHITFSHQSPQLLFLTGLRDPVFHFLLFYLINHLNGSFLLRVLQFFHDENVVLDSLHGGVVALIIGSLLWSFRSHLKQLLAHLIFWFVSLSERWDLNSGISDCVLKVL